MSQNPYAPPDGDANEQAEKRPLRPGERIHFSGTVSRSVLIASLRSRLSWPGLAALGVGALICLSVAPAGFLNPLRRFERTWVLSYRPDTLGEQLGLIGIGFLMLAGWHLICSCSSWNMLRRERQLLRRTPALYQQSVQGWISDECMHLREGDSEAWISWAGVSHYEVGDQLILIDWGAGNTGNTFLTEAMLGSREQFIQAARSLRAFIGHDADYQRFGDLPRFFHPPEVVVAVQPDDLIAESETEVSNRDAWYSVVQQIPQVLLVGGLPLHCYFGCLLLAALLFVDSFATSLVWIVGIWLLVVSLGLLLTLWQHRGLVLNAKRRLIANRTLLTREGLLILTTVGFYRLPLTDFRIRCPNGTIELQHIASGSTHTFEQSDICGSPDKLLTDDCSPRAG